MPAIWCPQRLICNKRSRCSRRGDHSSSIETADILVQYAQFELSAKSDPQQARKLFGEALGIYRSILGAQHLSVAVTLSGLAVAAIWMDDFAAAERYEREAIEIFRATVSRNYPDHAVALATLGYILTERGEYAEAEQLLKEALEIERSVFGEHNVRVIQAEDHLGDSLRATRRHLQGHRAHGKRRGRSPSKGSAPITISPATI